MFELLIKASLILALGGSMQATPSSGGGSIGSVGANLHFPRLISKDLAGKRIDIPGELPGERTVLLIAFLREQQREIDGWVAGLHLNNGKVPWLEVPVIDNPGTLVRWFIDLNTIAALFNAKTTQAGLP